MVLQKGGVRNGPAFHDLDSSGTYSEGDEIYDSASSNSQAFTLTDEPVIYCLDPSTTPPTRPGDGEKVLVRGRPARLFGMLLI